ncbi:putative secreted protein (Por secretion system target) [Mariniflexile fucanivorans]|uniref:Putative secreted protein (Por secretion system target) n=1 Tax=Mariniflexile fucanivorans TaxID=264023 RepID=A0A4R1RP12_9FLAO|nr:T9SS type A sorting domain-containing protein [Mariniflexile fucanivorans]TCL68071.1 putative secreted protein (Por secretion system target) [Mariniflexile fucanivorans]
MNPKIRLIFLLLICNYANAQYVGGKDDGSAVSPLNGSRLSGEIASFAVLYQGSSGDGFDSKTNQVLLLGSNFEIYDGSSGDGFSQKIAALTISGNKIDNLYGGNSGDGFSEDQFQSLLNGQALSMIYQGNFGDGSDNVTANSLFLQGFMNNLFQGGNGDGFASLLSSNNYLSGLMLALFNGGTGDGFATNTLTSALTLDIIDHLIEMDVLLYPNPASHIVNIKPNNQTNITSIELYNVSGQKMPINLSYGNTIDVSNLSDGMYLLNIFSETGAITKKLIIKK